MTAGSREIGADIGQRLDKWLFFSRLIRSREKAQQLIRDGHVRLNGKRCDVPAHIVRPGDVLTIGFEHQIRVVRILAAGDRRGPADEARALYEDAAEPVRIAKTWP